MGEEPTLPSEEQRGGDREEPNEQAPEQLEPCPATRR